MRGKVARELRRIVYPGNMSHRVRSQTTIPHERVRPDPRGGVKRVLSVQVVSDVNRCGYKHLKREHSAGIA